MSRGKRLERCWPWSVGLAEIMLRYMPSPLFRNGDVYDVCDDLGLDRVMGPSAWHLWKVRGLIVQTDVTIGIGPKGGFYWTRSNCRVTVTDENRFLMTRPVGRLKAASH